MKLRRVLTVGACLLLLSYLLASPARAYGSGSRTDADSACGTYAVVLTANCATLSIAATAGSCTVNNRGLTTETLVCSSGTYSVSGSVSGWLSSGSAQITMGGDGCSVPTLSRQDFNALAPSIQFGPYTITCDGFTVTYGNCRQPYASASMAFTAGPGGTAPRTLSASASINQQSDGCNPDHD